MTDHLSVVARVGTPRGELVLRRTRDRFELISDGTFLMDTRDGRSERLLVEAALARALLRVDAALPCACSTYAAAEQRTARSRTVNEPRQLTRRHSF